MNIVKVMNGKVKLWKDTGLLIRHGVTSGAVDADINDDGTLVLVKTANGKVELRRESGSLVRHIVTSDGTRQSLAEMTFS